MKMNKDGTLARFYEWSHNATPPTNFCNYFWGLIFAVLLLPLTWITFPLNVDDFDHGLGARTFIGGLGHFLLSVLVGIGWRAYQEPWHALIASGIIVGIVIVAGGAFFLSEFATGSETYREIRTVVSEKKDAVKNKYCPRIDWE